MERNSAGDGGGRGERHHQHKRPRGRDCGEDRRLRRGEAGRETAGKHGSIDGRRRRGVRAVDDEEADCDDETRRDVERTREETGRHEHRHGDGGSGGEGDGDSGGGRGNSRKTGRKRDDGGKGGGGRGRAEGDKRRDRRRERRRDDRGRFADAIDETDVLDVFEAVDGPVVTTTDVADVLGVTTEAARQRLNGLVQDGHLRRRKTGRTVVYWRTDR